MVKNEIHKLTKYFIEGKLSEEKEQELLSWIKASKANKEYFLEEQRSISQSEILNKDTSVRLKWLTLKNRINEKEPQRNKSLFFRVTSVAAAFIAGIILTTLIINTDIVFTKQTTQIQTITVPNGARTNITLPDGSIVWLNSGSTLSFPQSFNKTRPVTLKGEAFFEVVKSKNPFVVSTTYGEVEVKGTSFNVKAFENEYLQATLVTGSVLIREKESKREVTLRPGQQAKVAENKFAVENVDTEIYTSWKEGKIIFRKEFLPDVAKRLERWYNVKIAFEKDPRLNEIWYSGTIEMESFSEVLELLKVTAPIDYTYNDKTRVITIKYKQN